MYYQMYGMLKIKRTNKRERRAIGKKETRIERGKYKYERTCRKVSVSEKWVKVYRCDVMWCNPPPWCARNVIKRSLTYKYVWILHECHRNATAITTISIPSKKKKKKWMKEKRITERLSISSSSFHNDAYNFNHIGWTKRKRREKKTNNQISRPKKRIIIRFAIRTDISIDSFLNEK